MALVEKNDIKQIFADQAPSIDKPASFANYPRGWDTARPNNGKPTIKQFNYLQQRTDQNILWMHQNGAALPYDATMEYAEGAVVVKDGKLQQKQGGSWVEVAGGVDPSVIAEIEGKADRVYVDSQLSTKAEKQYIDDAVANNEQFVNDAISNLSTLATKFYPTLAAANADIANLEVNQPVQIGDAENGGLYYKASDSDTSLTKSDYDPLTLYKKYAENTLDDAGVHARIKSSLLQSGITDQERIDTLLSKGGSINFTDGTTLFDGKTYADLSKISNITVSRASEAYVLNASNVYVKFPTNEVRKINGKGLFLEKGATQLLAQPADLSNSAWVKTGATVATVEAGAPDLTGNAFNIVESADGSGSSYIQSNVTLAVGSNCFSAFLSRGGNRYAQMFIVIGSGTYSVSIDFDSEKVQSSAGALALTSFGIEKIKSNLYRVWLSISLAVTSSATVHIRGAGGMTFADRIYTRVNGRIAVRAAWAQVEAGLKPSSPILVGGGTRAADSFKIAWLGSNLDDEIAVSYDSETVKLKRSALINSQEFDMTRDGGFPWSGKFISSSYFFPAKSKTFFANYKNVDDRASALATQNAVTSTVLNAVLAKLGAGDFSLDYSNSLSVIKPTDNGCTPYLFIDNSSKKYYWHGQFYDTQESLLAESGGVKTGQVLSWNATHVSDENLFLSDFNSGVDGFSLVSSGSVAAVAGELEFTSTASTGTFARSFRGFGGKALRLSAKYRKGTSIGARIGASSYNQGLVFSPLVTGSSSASFYLDFSPVVGRQFWIGGGQNGGGLGTSYFDDFKLQEVFPLAGFPQARYTVVIDAVAPATLPVSGEQVLWQIDCGTSNDRVYVSIDSTGTIKLTSRYWGVTGGTDYAQKSIITLGAVSANATFKLAFSVTNSQISAALNGVGSSVDTVGAIGAAYLRIGSSTTVGEEFSGVISSISMYIGAESLVWLKDKTTTSTIIPAYAKSQKRILMIGDSWSEDSSTGIGPMLRDLGYEVYSVGVGGSTMEQQRDYALAEPDLLKACTLIWWDGVPNGHVNGQIELEKSYLQDVLAAAGHNRFLWCRNGQAQVDNTQQADMDAFRLWVSQKYGSSHVYDPNHIYVDYAIKDPDNAGYAADQARLAQQSVPYSLMLPDEAHLISDIRRVIAKDMQKTIYNLK